MLAGQTTQEQIHLAGKQNYKDYKGQDIQLKAIYIPRNIIEKFIKEFYRGEI